MENSNDQMNDQQFDALLRHALLDDDKLFNEKNTETMAQHIFNAYADTTGVAEQPQVLRKLLRDFRRKGWNRKLNIFLVSLAITLVVINFFVFTKDRSASINPHTDSAITAQRILMEQQANAKKMEILTENPLPVTNPLIIALNDSGEQLIPMEHVQPAEHHYVMTDIHIVDDRILHYEDIPTLTEAEKIQTAKDKLKMLKEIANPKKKIFGQLPMGKVNVDGKTSTIQRFRIKNAEVSNFEYRTFLNDLLVQGKFDDYLESAPVKGLWKTAGIPEFEDIYFSSPKYNDFPIVCISRKGAENYCKWLSDEMKKAIDSKAIKFEGNPNPEFRLPCNLEWIYAARGGDSTVMKYPWGKYYADSVNNKNGCFLCNFNWTVTKELYEGHHICEGYKKLKQGGFHHAIVTTAGLAIDTLLTAPVYSYNPNETGQYCMMGNVSEMVWTFVPGSAERGDARAMGGNWNSPLKEVLIESPEQYVGVTQASPYIGFRPVMVWK